MDALRVHHERDHVRLIVPSGSGRGDIIDPARVPAPLIISETLETIIICGTAVVT